LLEGEEVDFVPFVGGRDPLNVARNFRHARRILGQDVDAIVSTGSSVALPFFLLGRLKGLDLHYIESAARGDGPSMTGKLIGTIPGVNLYSQYRSWAEGRWNYRGAVFDAYEPAPLGSDANRIQKVVVTLGTYRGYQFPRIVERLLEILPADSDVLWQTGDTDVAGFGIDGKEAIPERELTAAMKEADVIVAHAGVGAALASVEMGRSPLLVPRRLSLGEHIDDHQIQIARELEQRGLATTVEADQNTISDLLKAANSSVVPVADPPPFELSRRQD
jgi:UDP-N-acetylglucosamine transferase subunit ALG13